MNTFRKSNLIFFVGIAGFFFCSFMAAESFASPAPEIMANNSSESITMYPENNLFVSVRLNVGTDTGEMANWWALVQAPSGWHYYDLHRGWTPGYQPTFHGALRNISPRPILNYSGLPEGSYTFFFGVELDSNGDSSTGRLYYDSMSVHIVVPPAPGDNADAGRPEGQGDSSRGSAGSNNGSSGGSESQGGEFIPAVPDPEYDNMTWTLPTGASGLRLSLPADINDFLPGLTGGFGLHSGGHIEGLDHVWLHLKPGTPVRSWADGYVEDVRPSGMTDLGEYSITIRYGENLVGIHMEVEPLVEKYTNVSRGQIIGTGMSFGEDYSSAEFSLIDRGRSDGVKAFGGGVYVSPFDYLRDDDKRKFVEAYKKNVLDPYQEEGVKPSIDWEPYQPYLTNNIFLHEKNKITGVWYLKSQAWGRGFPNDVLTFMKVNNPYFTGRAVYAEDDSSEGGYDIKGTYEIDYDRGRIRIHNTHGPDYYGIFEIDESEDRAKLTIEYREGDFPASFSGNALTYIQRSNLTRREDARALGVLD